MFWAKGMYYKRAIEHIEILMATNTEIEKVLRLLCLQSVCNSGIDEKKLNFLKKEILQVYGFNHLTSLQNLKNANILRKKG